jgi:RNA polymerase sigma-70 factor (ECF subfamily)
MMAAAALAGGDVFLGAVPPPAAWALGTRRAMALVLPALTFPTPLFWPTLCRAELPPRRRQRSAADSEREARLRHLAELFQTGHQESFDEIAELVRDQIHAVAWRYAGNREDALDIAQNVLIRVFRALPRWKGQCGFSTWVHRIAMNASVDYLRRQSRHEDRRVDPERVKTEGEGRGSSDPFLGVSTETPRHAAQRNEVVQLVREALPKLSEMQRECFVLRHFHGMSIEEIAETAGCSAGSVKRHLFRASRRLRELLADLEPALEGGTLTPAEE